jgi:two-component system chemotaxis sensor kinase CheA
MDEILGEFLTESHENLGQLDQDLVELEKDPRSADRLASVFRTFHTMKGVAGFLNLSKLEALAHAAEDLLSSLRDGELILDAAITSSLLAAVDAVRQMLATVEASGSDGATDYSDLIGSLRAFLANQSNGANEPGDEPAPPVIAHAGKGNAMATNGSADGLKQRQQNELEHNNANAAVLAPHENVAHGEVAGQSGGDVTEAKSSAEPAPQAASGLAVPAANAARNELGEPAVTTGADSTIRVNVHLLDKLMNLVGELVLVRNQVLQFASSLQEATFLGASQRLNLITTELQGGIMKTRMQPIGNIWNKFPRIVRDLALACGKQVRIEMEGEETELDKTLIEAIRDPLTHLVRNAIDHGIESPRERLAAGKPSEGRLLLRAFHESGQVIVEVAEDGAGIDLERVRAKALERGLVNAEQAARMNDAETVKLVFLPGFSTAAKVTNISGRGVGMDVVQTNIEKIGGTVDIQSRRGEGTTLRIKIPLTLAIIPALVVTCVGDRYMIPQVNLIELVRLDGAESERRIERVHGAPVYRLRGNLLPLVYLEEVLKLAKDEAVAATPDHAANIVVLQVGDQQFGLVVDEVNDTEEIVVKPLGKRLKGMSAFAGATIMGDGRVALILDVLGVVQLAAVARDARQSGHAEAQKASAHVEHQRQRLLLCRAEGADCVAVPLALVSRLEEFPRASVERAAGCQVVSYRGKILPLVELGELAGGGARVDDGEERDPLKVVVFDDGERRVGMVVAEIIDIVEEEAVAVQLSSRTDLIGSALVGKKTTDFLDLRAVFEAARRNWYDAKSAGELNHAAVLLIDQSAFTRGLVRSYLEMAGHQVHEARDSAEALEKLQRLRVQLALVSANLPGNGKVLAQLRKRTSEAHIPLIGLADERAEVSPEMVAKYDACHFKSDRQAILDAVEKLTTQGAPGPAAPLADTTPHAS